jgi:hypothetical protein
MAAKQKARAIQTPHRIILGIAFVTIASVHAAESVPPEDTAPIRSDAFAIQNFPRSR